MPLLSERMWRVLLTIRNVVMAVTGVIGVVARFFVQSPLWLDEALTVNISSLPLGQIGPALRHDGHPPLFYVLLHGWMDLFGSSNLAVRALPALISVIGLPLAYAVGKRVGGNAVAWLSAWLYATSPFMMRYGSETRMYSLVVVLVLAGYLLIDVALAKDSWPAILGVATVSCALLWSHYWSFWLLAALGSLLIVQVWRRSRRHRPIRRELRLLGALVAAGIGYLPWLPALLYQAQHTGTPWADVAKPPSIIVTTLSAFAGGAPNETSFLALILVVVLITALFTRPTGPSTMSVNLHTQLDARWPAGIAGLTIAIGAFASLATSSGFSGRYAAVIFPFVLVLLALGLARLPEPIIRSGMIVVLLFFSVTGSWTAFHSKRTQAGDATAMILAEAKPNPVVLACPDQLGPALERAAEGRFEVLPYPTLGSPKFVDWVDYAARNAKLDPTAIADAVLERAGTRDIVVAFGTYKTFEGQCDAVIARLSQSRSGRVMARAQSTEYYEPTNLQLFAGVAPG
jgi:hypothetical protein